MCIHHTQAFNLLPVILCVRECLCVCVCVCSLLSLSFGVMLSLLLPMANGPFNHNYWSAIWVSEWTHTHTSWYTPKYTRTKKNTHSFANPYVIISLYTEHTESPRAFTNAMQDFNTHAHTQTHTFSINGRLIYLLKQGKLNLWHDLQWRSGYSAVCVCVTDCISWKIPTFCL